MNLPYWLYREFWAYVFDDSRADHDYGPMSPELWGWSWPWSDDYIENYFARFVNWCARCLCRARRHPAGVYFYSNGLEPDMRCMGCGEDLG